MRSRSAWAVVAVLMSAGMARADVEVFLEIQGYSELFEECKIALGFDAPPAYASIDFGYDITLSGGKGPVQCDATWEDGFVNTSCQAPPQTHYSCEEMTAVRAIGMRCRDAAGEDIACGSVTLTGPKADFFIFD